MQLKDYVVLKLENAKAKDLKVIDVHQKTDHFKEMIICTGTSSRHTQSIAQTLLRAIKTDQKELTASLEGDLDAKWLLLDLGDVIVHIFQEEERSFYNLEELWERRPVRDYA